jgi:oxygen-dependent protoporphyrinogen oxidase
VSDEPHVAVVGGGISGLVAADVLLRSGAARVTLLEAEGRLGGKIRSEPIAGQAVDVGAESLFAYAPAAVELCRELGLQDELVGARETTTSVWARGRLRELPSGILSGLPDGVGPVLRSGILSPAGLARGALDLVLPASRADGDRAVGEFVRRRLGRAALDRLVDPLLGTIYAADCEQLSLRATAPALDALAREHRSLIRGLRATKPPAPQAGPMFVTLPGGLERIVTRLRERLLKADIRCDSPVRLLEREQDGCYRLELGGRESLLVDGVVLAAPADQAGRILSAVSPVAAGELDAIRYVPTVIVALSYPTAATSRLGGAGFLVPKGERRLLGACTSLSAKWSHFADTGELWLRCSVARASAASALDMDDAELVGRLTVELGDVMGLQGAPLSSHVTRWERALPLYEPGHLERVARVEEELEHLGGVALAGAAYGGIGVPHCIMQGRTAAERVLAAFDHGGSAAEQLLALGHGGPRGARDGVRAP